MELDYEGFKKFAHKFISEMNVDQKNKLLGPKRDLKVIMKVPTFKVSVVFAFNIIQNIQPLLTAKTEKIAMTHREKSHNTKEPLYLRLN